MREAQSSRCIRNNNLGGRPGKRVNSIVVRGVSTGFAAALINYSSTFCSSEAVTCCPDGAKLKLNHLLLPT